MELFFQSLPKLTENKLKVGIFSSAWVGQQSL